MKYRMKARLDGLEAGQTVYTFRGETYGSTGVDRNATGVPHVAVAASEEETVAFVSVPATMLDLMPSTSIGDYEGLIISTPTGLYGVKGGQWAPVDPAQMAFDPAVKNPPIAPDDEPSVEGAALHLLLCLDALPLLGQPGHFGYPSADQRVEHREAWDRVTEARAALAKALDR